MPAISFLLAERPAVGPLRVRQGPARASRADTGLGAFLGELESVGSGFLVPIFLSREPPASSCYPSGLRR